MSSEGNSKIISNSVKSYDDFINYEGFWYFPKLVEKIKVLQMEFEAKPSDILLCSFPKSGTTWLKALAFATIFRAEAKVANFNPTITNYAASSSCGNPLLVYNPHECVEFIERTTSAEIQNLHPSLSSIIKQPRRRLLATHIPYSSLPKSVIESGCKIVYICRDPKDVFVSLWHFAHDIAPWLQGVTLQEMFEKTCQGIDVYGPVWEHVLGFWKAANERQKNVLFLRYEDLKSQTSYSIKKLAEFLEEPFSQEEEESGLVDKIIELCSFEHLRSLETNKNGSYNFFDLTYRKSYFFRKGQVKDWKNHLTIEMKEKMDKIIRDKFSGTSLNILNN